MIETASNNPHIIPIWVTDPVMHPAARRLADSFGLPLLFKLPVNAEYYLALTTQRLELRGGKSLSEGAVFAEFITGKMGYRRSQGFGRRQPIAKAVGIKKDYLPTILDATPGLGRDGFVLACLGCHVRWIERSPVVAALLADGLERAGLDASSQQIIADNTSLENADARDSMEAGPLNDREPEDVVYLDPMYPHRTKTALVKKEMRRLRSVVGEDSDADALLDSALRYATRRVVVKRPQSAEPLAGKQPDFAITAKKTRFDVYLTVEK